MKKRGKLFTFYEVPAFRRTLDNLTSIETLYAIQADLLENPTRGAIIAGTSGVRKARVADKDTRRGKSGSYRYLYLLLDHVGVIYLLVFFSKGEMENISKSDKEAISKLVKLIKEQYR